ncbi:MAG: hypothetical protein ACRCX5_12730, partial [Bacteroidales bacterium]
MAKLIVTSVQPQTIITSYTPLITNFEFVIDGGAPSQFYYTNTNQFIPNRQITPIVISPKLHIVDPDGILSNGDASSSLAVQ